MIRRPRPLLRAGLELLNALNALRPLALHTPVSLASFPTGWPTSELPGLVLGGSLLDAARRGRRGDFAGRRGVAALLLTVLSWLVLAVVRRRGATTAAPVLAAALAGGSAPSDGSAAPLAADPLPPRPGAPAGVLATMLSRRRYAAGTIGYGPHGRANLADIWRRPDLPADGRAPVLVQVPGGAWMLGDRRPQSYPLLSHFAERGWVCVSIGYRVSPKHTWPAQIVDVKRALAWVKKHIADYGGDPDTVMITGGSAGGHLAALAALSAGDPAFQPGFEAADTSVAAAVPVYGRYDWLTAHGPTRAEFGWALRHWIVKKGRTAHPGIYTAASPIRRVRADAPPFFVLHGASDSLIPVGEARDFVAALRAVSTTPVTYAELPYAQHAFDFFGSPRAEQTVAAVHSFLARVRAQRAG